jgi:hypothetical membrane protein
MALSDASKAGLAIFIGGVQFGIAMILAEVYYPGYNVSTNYISDLGATCPDVGRCTIYQPTSTIFNSSIVVYGLLGLVGAYFINRAFKWKPATGLIIVTSIGAIGVGLFPETTGIWHSIFSLIVFLFAGLTAIITFWLQKPPQSYLSALMGAVSLTALFFYVGGVYLGLGPGGLERMVAYPVILWTIAFGAHMMGLERNPRV